MLDILEEFEGDASDSDSEGGDEDSATDIFASGRRNKKDKDANRKASASVQPSVVSRSKSEVSSSSNGFKGKRRKATERGSAEAKGGEGDTGDDNISNLEEDAGGHIQSIYR